jgi:nucleoside-diphosphate-sugar epimerase
LRVLVTGHLGYIGTVLTPLLLRAGHDVVGLDSDLYSGCTFGPLSRIADVPTIRKDLRDIEISDLKGFDAIAHLAALSNDPLGDIDASCTYEINLRGSIRLAELARTAGVRRFIFSSSCSVYGAAGDDFLDESAAFNPVTPYGESKVGFEQAVRELATDSFSPTFLRNATAYGASPRLRLDLVVNDMVAAAITTGRIVVKSDGTPWRPLVHIEDISRAFLCAIEAPIEAVHNQSFNIGATAENYRVSEVAEMVQAGVPGSVVEYAAGGGPDTRCYRVDFTKAATGLPGFTTQWTVAKGIAQLAQQFREYGFTALDTASDKYVRLRRIRTRLADGTLRDDLRPSPATTVQDARTRQPVGV